ncbi:hypothetical protein KR222_008126, partial [Zaprionus bogoriensis]
IIPFLFNKQARKMAFRNGDCIFNREIFHNFTLRLPNELVKMDIKLAKVLSFGLMGHLAIEFRSSKAKQYQHLIHHDLDYCALLRDTQNTLRRRWLQSMLKNGNFSTSCPIQPGDYYLHGWRLHGNLIPSFLSFGEYRIEGSFYFGKYRKNVESALVRCTVEANL